MNLLIRFISALSSPFYSKEERKLLRTYLRRKFSLTVGDYHLYGKNNRVLLIKDGVEKPMRFCRVRGLSILVRGKNNVIKLHYPIVAFQSKIKITANDAIVEIGATDTLNGVQINCVSGCGQVCRIGKGSTFSATEITLCANSVCIIGEDCMFSHNVVIWGDDGHPIIDNQTQKIINNHSNGIRIGNHCWIAQNVYMTKNAVIPSHTIVGMCAVVTKAFQEEYTVLGGNPARVVKTNVSWKRH